MLEIQRISSRDLSPRLIQKIRQLCDSAYGEATGWYFDAIGPGEHLLGWHEGDLVSHLMWVTRRLQPGEGAMLRTAYVEMVATAPAHQRRGLATALLRRFPSEVAGFDLAALSPATESLYARLGWRLWRGPLAVRTEQGLVPTPEEQVMVLPLPGGPGLDLDLPLSVEWRRGEVW